MVCANKAKACPSGPYPINPHVEVRTNRCRAECRHWMLNHTELTEQCIATVTINRLKILVYLDTHTHTHTHTHTCTHTCTHTRTHTCTHTRTHTHARTHTHTHTHTTASSTPSGPAVRGASGAVQPHAYQITVDASFACQNHQWSSDKVGDHGGTPRRELPSPIFEAWERTPPHMPLACREFVGFSATA